MLEKTTCEIFCQKRPPTSGGTPWPGDTWHVPPGPVPAGPCRRYRCRHVVSVRPGGPCRHPRCRQGDVIRAATSPAATSPAANGNGGMVPPRHLPATAWCATSPAGNGNGGRGLPALAQAARATCRGAATRRGSFLTKIFAGGLF
jgi:hypothetical protein